jgi:hypothetical protein
MPEPAQQPARLTWSWFPLVQRPRPPALPLKVRVDELTGLTAKLAQGGQASLAAEICNKAALIASDCGVSELARDLCWRQHHLLTHSMPLTAQMADLASQPLLNLARQHIRDGEPDTAYAMLQSLYHAAQEQADITIGGQRVSMSAITSGHDSHRIVCTRLWTAFIADGTRALAQAGRWRDAAEHAALHRGVGTRLLDGRQAAIIALLHEGNTGEAIRLTQDSAAEQTWERAVKQLLRAACLSIDQTATQSGTDMLTSIHELLESASPSTAVFSTRAAIFAHDLADSTQRPSTFVSKLGSVASMDARAACDVLHRPCLRSAIAPSQREQLTMAIEVSGIGVRRIPEPARRAMLASVSRAETRLRSVAVEDLPVVLRCCTGSGGRDKQ